MDQIDNQAGTRAGATPIEYVAYAILADPVWSIRIPVLPGLVAEAGDLRQAGLVAADAISTRLGLPQSAFAVRVIPFVNDDD